MKLKLQAETVKRVLSTLDTANCYIESLCEGIDLNCNVTRARFDNELGKILSGFVDPVTQTLADAGIKPANVDKVRNCLLGVSYHFSCETVTQMTVFVLGRYGNYFCQIGTLHFAEIELL